MFNSKNAGRVFAGAIGVLAFGAAIVGIVLGWNAAAWIVLLGVVLACVLLVISADRMKGGSVELGITGIRVETNLAPALVDEIESGFDALAATYTFIHTQLADDGQGRAVKIKLQDGLVNVAAESAAKGNIARDDVERAITSGIAAIRPLAFGVLTSKPQWATAQLLVQGISNSQSGNEQFHALRAAEAAWPKLEARERQLVDQTIRSARWINEDDDRRELAQRILALSIG